MHSLLTFSFTLLSLPRPSPSLPSLLRLQGLLQLRGYRAVEMHRLRRKGIDYRYSVYNCCFCLAARHSLVRFPATDARPKRHWPDTTKNCIGKALVHVEAFTVLHCFPTTSVLQQGQRVRAKLQSRQWQTMWMRTRANMKKPMREKFLFGMNQTDSESEEEQDA